MQVTVLVHSTGAGRGGGADNDHPLPLSFILREELEARDTERSIRRCPKPGGNSDAQLSDGRSLTSVTSVKILSRQCHPFCKCTIEISSNKNKSVLMEK